MNASRCAPQEGRDAPRVASRAVPPPEEGVFAPAPTISNRGSRPSRAHHLTGGARAATPRGARASAARPPHVPIVVLRVTHYSLSDFERIELNVRNPNPTIVL